MLVVRSVRRSLLRLALAGALALTVAIPQVHAFAPPDGAGKPDKPDNAGAPGQLRAYLDGKRINLKDVSLYYCHDFAYPEIQCFTSPEAVEADAQPAEEMMALAGWTYVTVYEHNTYAGAYMHISQNYDMLFWVNWNDKISSLRSRNSGSGTFWTDWFGGGTWFPFCCNQGFTSLGNFNDRFSSVYQN